MRETSDENAATATSENAEDHVAALNHALAPLERERTASFELPRQPTIFIVGAPRSGTTLLTQLLIRAYKIGYVNNLAARFWKAPYLGMQLIAQVRDETEPPEVGLSSNYGATSGYEGPHEFGHFWRRWFAYGNTHDVSEEKLKDVDVAFFQRECAAMESVSGGPFLFKNLTCSFQISFLARVLPKAFFVHCRRRPLYVAQSLLRAREQYAGSKKRWFSVKPAAYPSLRDRPYPEQIVGQIFHTRRRVKRDLQHLPTHRFYEIDYESLVKQPELILEEIANLVRAEESMERRSSFTASVLSSTNEPGVGKKDLRLLKENCHRFFKEPTEVSTG